MSRSREGGAGRGGPLPPPAAPPPPLPAPAARAAPAVAVRVVASVAHRQPVRLLLLLRALEARRQPPVVPRAPAASPRHVVRVVPPRPRAAVRHALPARRRHRVVAALARPRALTADPHPTAREDTQTNRMNTQESERIQGHQAHGVGNAAKNPGFGEGCLRVQTTGILRSWHKMWAQRGCAPTGGPVTVRGSTIQREQMCEGVFTLSDARSCFGLTSKISPLHSFNRDFIHGVEAHVAPTQRRKELQLKDVVHSFHGTGPITTHHSTLESGTTFH